MFDYIEFSTKYIIRHNGNNVGFILKADCAFRVYHIQSGGSDNVTIDQTIEYINSLAADGYFEF